MDLPQAGYPKNNSEHSDIEDVQASYLGDVGTEAGYPRLTK